MNLNYFGQFHILKNRENFSSPKAALASFLLHFSNSDACQTMPENGHGASANHQSNLCTHLVLRIAVRPTVQGPDEFDSY